MITRIAHICLGSTDLEVTERFYCQGLGLERHFDFRRAGRRVGFYLRVGDGSFIEVFEAQELGCDERHPMRHLCLEVDDIDATMASMRSAGIAVGDKKQGADRSWQCWLSDPDGVRIECHQYTAESSQRTRADCLLPDS